MPVLSSLDFFGPIRTMEPTVDAEGEASAETMGSIMNNLVFSKVELYGDEDRRKVFDVMDRIRELHIDDISLPELVAIGDQSSGKSSVLESITGIPFPADSKTCTRFPTQIALRRTASVEDTAMVRATLIPAGPLSEISNQARKEFEGKHSCKAEEFGPEKFKELIDEAGKLMGIRAGGERFSKDRLRIEFSAPYQSDLTIVDVPGIIQHTSKRENDGDKKKVIEIIKKFVEAPETIILAVMNGHNNIENQGAFSIVRDMDPERKRTVGVITKCDVLEKSGKLYACEVGANEIEPLRHGWFMVRNRTQEESENGITMEQRREREADFFKEWPWPQNLRPERLGIDNLKTFLGNLLHEHIRKELPKITKELNGMIKDSKEELEAMWRRPGDPSSQRTYLTKFAGEYKTKVDKYLAGGLRKPLDLDHPLKIRTRTQKLNDDFAERMKKHGHTRPFGTLDGNDDGTGFNLANAEVPKIDIYSWITKVYRASRGTELKGLLNSDLVAVLFHDQAMNWAGIAEDHVEAVINVVKEFNVALFKEVVRDETVRERILTKIENETVQRFNAARSSLSERIQGEFGDHLQTVDEQYEISFQESKRQRIEARLQIYKFREFSAARLRDAASKRDVDGLKIIQKMESNAAGEPSIPFSLDNWVEQSLKNFIGEEAIVHELHDCLKAFYPVALRRFVDNVNLKVIEEDLLGENGPVRLFNDQYIAKLSPEDLHNITKEDDRDAEKRKQLESRMDRATEALRAVHSI
ncbi:hypothetical protein TWF281_009603 [Arthrobotrys megalospora]